MNNDHIIKEDIAALAAKSLVHSRPKHTKAKAKGKHPGCIYAIVASESQYAADERVRIIDDFVKATRRYNKGTRTSTLREFILNAVHDAIVKQAERGKRNERIFKHIEERENRAVLGSTFVDDITDGPNNIGLTA